VVGLTGAVRTGRASGRTTALLSLLDLSAAFDSVDHDTLLQRLQGVTGVLRSGRERYRLVRLLSYWTYASPDCRIPVDIVGNVVGVSQGSVLRPILFLLYVADLLQLVKRHSLHPQCYADDSMSS